MSVLRLTLILPDDAVFVLRKVSGRIAASFVYLHSKNPKH